MRLIYYNKVESSCRKSLCVAVDVIYHRLISTEHEPCIHVFLSRCREFTDTHVWKEFNEVSLRLVHERCSVCEEKDIFHPLIASQNIDQRNSDARLTCPGCHH